MLIHAQAIFVGMVAYYYSYLYLTFFEVRSKALGVQSINLLNLIPWFVIFQLYVLLIPKAVRFINFTCCYCFSYGLKRLK